MKEEKAIINKGLTKEAAKKNHKRYLKVFFS